MNTQQEAVPSEQEMLTYIVSEINSVLGRNYRLVEFDSFEGDSLLRVLADLFQTLSPQVNLDMKPPNIDEKRARLLEFLLKTIGYKIPAIVEHSFRDFFFKGDKTVLYSVLYWTLKNMKQNAKRVYLARFLSPIDIPEDLKHQDDRVRDVFMQFESLRTAFIATHKRVDALRETHANPEEARRRIAVLEKESERLRQYINAGYAKLKSVPNKDALLTACRELRAQKGESVKVNEQYRQQQRALAVSRGMHETVLRHQRAVQEDLREPRSEVILRRLQEQVHSNRFQLDEILPRRLMERRAQVEALEALMAGRIDLTALQTQLQTLESTIVELSAKAKRRAVPFEDGSTLDALANQVSRLREKKLAIVNEVSSLKSAHSKLLEQVETKKGQIASFEGQRMLNMEDVHKLENEVAATEKALAQSRQRVNELRAEYGVMCFTLEIVQRDFDSVREEVERREREMGITGYSEKAEGLARVTEEKNAVEELKGKTLEELAVIVQNVMASVKARKASLAPQIAELRDQRAELAEVEQDWEAKKTRYDQEEGLLMQDVTKMESDISSLESENKVNELLYHRLNAQFLVLNVLNKRLEDEKEFKTKKGKSLDLQGCSTYTQLLERTLAAVELNSKDLQRRRRDIEENHRKYTAQVKMFNSLKKILEMKLNILTNEGRGEAGPVEDRFEREIANVMSGVEQRRGDVDMLVLGGN